MKRSIGETEFIDSISMANCLISLSRGPDVDLAEGDLSPGRVFECKTCNRQFPSFQALGGHRASHKKPRLNPPEDQETAGPGSPMKPKTHECSVCGLEFAIGQALGGHMRRHRLNMNDHHPHEATLSTALSLLPPPPLTARHVGPVVKKSNGQRVLCLDLNLTPSQNDTNFRLGKAAAPALDCFL
ncbi:zinc finger protein ZAT12-like [Punica granatum]|uniref:Zinc finger protein ZAT12-like n=2 Tax=Punica granatum TaxID=22663 RepID=A0A6P8C6W5_PUNGR|nr:zinc finger protein ZAT12-like [Punica granatum]PKI72409.1 hypothetical protein CRG98_007279 [Punica granatum]